MSKYGKGLNVEFTKAVKQGLVNEPFDTNDIKNFALSKGWNPSPKYLSVALANGAAESHSLTYKKYFTSLGNGLYVLSDFGKQQ